jgi:hypothetical protein
VNGKMGPPGNSARKLPPVDGPRGFGALFKIFFKIKTIEKHKDWSSNMSNCNCIVSFHMEIYIKKYKIFLTVHEVGVAAPPRSLSINKVLTIHRVLCIPSLCLCLYGIHTHIHGTIGESTIDTQKLKK